MRGEVFDDPNIVLEAAALGRGLVLGFEPFCRTLLTAGRLVAVSPVVASSEESKWLIRRDSEDKEAGVFAGWLVERARESPFSAS